DGGFGFRVVHPTTGARRPVFGYEDVRAAGEHEERAERLRLYYVAMTRAIDRLIVSGAIDPEAKSERETPIGWVLRRLDADEELAAAREEPVELERGRARLLVRVDRYLPGVPEEAPVAVDGDGQLALFSELPTESAPRGIELSPLEPVPAPPLHQIRRLSYSALALFDRCSY